MFLFDFQNNGDVAKKVFNAIWETLLASTQHSFVTATSIVLVAGMKDLVVGYKSPTYINAFCSVGNAHNFQYIGTVDLKLLP